MRSGVTARGRMGTDGAAAGGSGQWGGCVCANAWPRSTRARVCSCFGRNCTGEPPWCLVLHRDIG